MAMAAEKPQLSSLKTPMSATYPSELRSPMLGAPHIKQEDKTPVTPPVAYTDFLKNLSPVLMSPLSTGNSLRFSLGDKSATIGSFDSAQSSTATSSNAPSGRGTPATASQPALSRTASTDSNMSSSTCASCESRKSATATPVSIPPPSPYINSAPSSTASRTPRRLRIPQSPSIQTIQSPASIRSPMSAPASARSIYSPRSARGSPQGWDVARTPVSAPPSGGTNTVTLKQVVKRTVVTTYSTTPLDPAPKGKRRKTDDEA